MPYQPPTGIPTGKDWHRINPSHLQLLVHMRALRGIHFEWHTENPTVDARGFAESMIYLAILG